MPPFFVYPNPIDQKSINSQGFLHNKQPMEILLGIIVFFMLLWYGLKFFLRYMLPWLIAHFFRRQQAKYGQKAQQNQHNKSRDGEVYIKKESAEKSKKDDGFGEYVDYEDVDNND